MTSPRTMNARRARIAALLSAHAVASQEDLGRLLEAEGVHVTQATLSRDLDALGAAKVSVEGQSRYVVPARVASDTSLPADGADAALARAAQELLLQADAAGNIAVVHTPPGAAQYFAGHLDRSHCFETVGSVAGDDTIILVMRTEADARALCQHLLELAEMRRTT